VALHIEGDVPFNVTHGDLCPIGSQQDSLFSAETISVHKADLVTSSRDNIGAAQRSQLLGMRFAQHSVQISSTPLSALPLTYVGHSPICHVTVHNSYVHIDQGVCARISRLAGKAALTVIDHRKFAYWLGGVASAHRRASLSIRPSGRAGVNPSPVASA
jgi:hypothetical protein